MSAEPPRQRARTEPKPGGKDDDPKNQNRFCEMCGDKLERDHTGIHCKNSHHLCDECSETYKGSIMNHSTLEVFPPKCGFCACEVDLLSFERQLSMAELETFLSMMTMKELPPDEVMHTCPFCPFFYTRLLSEGASTAEALFIHCMSPECRKVSCALCHKECVPCDDEDEDEDDEAVQLGMAEHFACAEKEREWSQWRKEFEDAIEKGIKFPCPRCGHGGVKDDACTHMTCDSCHTVWCYICGLDTASEDCSKAAKSGNHLHTTDEYRHSVNWHVDEKRCPMYLNQIHQVDESWPEDDEQAKEHLHRLRCLRNLKASYDKMGQARYRGLIDAFPRLGDASGFTEEDILKVDVDAPLFVRNGDFEGSDED